MKIKLFAIVLAALSLTACIKTPGIRVPEEADYVGTVTVESSAGPVENVGARVEFTPNEDGTAQLTLYEISFHPRMPMKVDVTIPGLLMTCTSEKIILTGDDIVPFALGGPFTNYTVTELRAEIIGNKMTLNLKFGGTPTSFVGEK